MDILGASSSTLMASIGTATQTTFASISPVIYGVAGLFLAFWLGKKLITLFPKK